MKMMTRAEAINEIKSWDFLEGKEIEAIHTLIPELRESEDEKIVQNLIDAFTEYKKSGGVDFHGIKINTLLSWLEKQKYDRMKPIYDARESFESALAKAWKEYNDSGSRTVDGCEDDYVECAHAKGFREGYLFGIEKHKENPKSADSIPSDCTPDAKCEDKSPKYSDSDGTDIRDTPAYWKGWDDAMKQKEQKHPNGCFTCDEYKKGYEAGRLNGFTAGYNKAMKEVDQKEQKPVKYLDKDKVYAIMTKLTNLSYSQLIPINSDEFKMLHEITAEVRDLLDYPVEPKPAEKQDYSELTDFEQAIHRGFLCAGLDNVPVTIIKETAQDCLNHMKPVEWSDTNELVFKDICKHLKEEGYNGWIVLLNALRNGEFQPKPEWSEEDEKMSISILNLLCSQIAYLASNGKTTGKLFPTYAKERDWFKKHIKSLRPDSYKNCNSRWKPSEEQMNALQCAIAFMEIRKASDYDITPLKSLYDHLKELI